MAQPRVLFLGRRVYDYLEATIVEGLIEAGFLVDGIAPANYISRVLPIEKIRGGYEFVFVNRQNLGLFKANINWARDARVVFVDGRDDPYLDLGGFACSTLYVKRELLVFPFTPAKLVPFSFGIERRYLDAGSSLLNWHDRTFDVFCAISLTTNPARRRYLETILETGNELNLRLFAQPTGERAYDDKSGLPIPTPRYHDGLSRSKAAVSMFGAGQDCARFWEILAAGALLISEKPTLVHQTLPREGSEALYFRGTSELKKILYWVHQHPQEASYIAAAGHRWALEHAIPRLKVTALIDQLNCRDLSHVRLSSGLFIATWTAIYNLRARFYLIWLRWVRPLII